MKTDRRNFLKLAAGTATCAVIPAQLEAEPLGIDDADEIMIVTLVIPRSLSGIELSGSLPRDTLYAGDIVSKEDLLNSNKMRVIGRSQGLAMYRGFAHKWGGE